MSFVSFSSKCSFLHAVLSVCTFQAMNDFVTVLKVLLARMRSSA